MSSVPEPVRRFIESSIDSVPELECLLLLYRFEGQGWTVEELSRRLYLSPQSACAVVAGLEGKQLIASIEDGGVVRCQYSPGSAALREATSLLEEAYRSQLMAITQLIHSKAPRAVLEFARAFRVAKDKK